MLLEPKETVINGKTYILSKFPAIAGREIITQYPISATPKLGDYEVNKRIMLKIMSFVGIPGSGNQSMQLTTEELVNNHVPDWETLMKLEWEMMEYNCSFFREGRVSSFLDSLAETLPDWITKMLTRLLPQLSEADKPHGENSKKSTRSKKQ